MKSIVPQITFSCGYMVPETGHFLSGNVRHQESALNVSIWPAELRRAHGRQLPSSPGPCFAFEGDAAVAIQKPGFVVNMENQQVPVPSSTGNSAQSSVITLWFPGGGMGEGIVKESGMDMDTLLDFTWRTSKDLLDSTGDSAQCHVAAWLGGEFGGECVCVYG